MRENNKKKRLYKEAIGRCCNPDCKSNHSALETHHIIPLSKGGVDDFVNYIVLCARCHRQLEFHFHRDYERHQISLLTFKFFIEVTLWGVSSEQEELFKAHLYKHMKHQHLLKKVLPKLGPFPGEKPLDTLLRWWVYGLNWMEINERLPQFAASLCQPPIKRPLKRNHTPCLQGQNPSPGTKRAWA